MLTPVLINSKSMESRRTEQKYCMCFFPAGAADVYASPATLRCFHNTSTLSWCFTSTEIVWLIRDGNLVLNAFTALACQISRLRKAHTHANRTFSGCITNLISILYVLLKMFSHANAKKKTTKTTKLKDFNFFRFYRFSSAILAVKGLSCLQLIYTGALTAWKYRNDLGRQRRRDKS